MLLEFKILGNIGIIGDCWILGVYAGGGGIDHEKQRSSQGKCSEHIPIMTMQHIGESPSASHEEKCMECMMILILGLLKTVPKYY